VSADGETLYALSRAADSLIIRNLASREVTALGKKMPANGAAALKLPTVLPPAPAPGASGESSGPLSGQLVASGKGGVAYAAQPHAGRILKVDAKGRVEIFAGTGAPAQRQACCGSVLAVATDAKGNVYVAGLSRTSASDGTPGYSRPGVWLFNTGKQGLLAFGQQVAPGRAVRVAGSETATDFDGEGKKATEVLLVLPFGLGIDRKGNLYVSDASANYPVIQSVRKIDSSGTMTTAVGAGQTGFNGDGLNARLSTLNGPAGLAIDQCGNLLIADSGNDRIRRLNLESACRAGRGGYPG